MRHLIALAFVLLTASSGAAGVVSFSDGTFTPLEWELVSETFGSAGGALAGGSAQATQASEGTPSPSRRVELVLPPAPAPTEYSSTYAVSIRPTSVYDPMVYGAVGSFDYEEDARVLVAPVLTGLAVRQGGELYFAAVQVVEAQSWTRVVRKAILQTDFVHLTPAGPVQGEYPDFGASAAPIELGFLRANSTGPGRPTGYSNPALIDNWLVRVNPTCTEQLDCEDGDPCGTEACVGGTCESTQMDCADDNPCTTDACAVGICTNLVIICDDGDACTTDTCAAGSCEHAALSCDDGDACTVDQCAGGLCQSTVVASTGLIEERIDALLAIVEGSCAGEPLVKKFGKKLVKKLRKARAKIAAADAATRPAAIAKLIGKSEVLLAAADAVLTSAAARGQVGQACAAELKSFLDAIRACAAAL